MNLHVPGGAIAQRIMEQLAAERADLKQHSSSAQTFRVSETQEANFVGMATPRNSAVWKVYAELKTASKPRFTVHGDLHNLQGVQRAFQSRGTNRNKIGERYIAVTTTYFPHWSNTMYILNWELHSQTEAEVTPHVLRTLRRILQIEIGQRKAWRWG